MPVFRFVFKLMYGSYFFLLFKSSEQFLYFVFETVGFLRGGACSCLDIFFSLPSTNHCNKPARCINMRFSHLCSLTGNGDCGFIFFSSCNKGMCVP
uniref:Uncharacterized protein n=1 Tax=Anguilla anguilla TaxID=7936 RepID=A0A0E9W6M4_ANGAN